MSNAYHNPALNTLLKDLRAEIKSLPKATKALQRVEAQLHYLDAVIAAHDAQHAFQAERALSAGNSDKASTFATLIWHSPTRDALYSQAQRMRGPLIDDAAERLAEALKLGREVLA